MHRRLLAFADRCLAIRFPEALAATMDFLFGRVRGPGEGSMVDHEFVVTAADNGGWQLEKDGVQVGGGTNTPGLANLLMGEVIYAMIDGVHSGVTLHGAAVTHQGRGIWLPGVSGAGKSSLTAWLISHGCGYLTDELIHCPLGGLVFEAFSRPLNFKNHGWAAIEPLLPPMESARGAGILAGDSVTMVAPECFSEHREEGSTELSLLLFPAFSPADQPEIRPLSPAEAGMRLMGCHVNARNLDRHGFPEIVKICRQVPACQVTFDSFACLDGVLDACIDLLLHDGPPKARIPALTRLASRGLAGRQPAASTEKSGGIPAASPDLGRKKMTIGMATYDDYDGVYFTIQAISLYHPEVRDDVEFLVIDNHPGGPASQALKRLECLGNYRYVPHDEKTGTAVRDQIFAEAHGDSVLCVDSHVLIAAGGLARLIAYFDDHPGCRDLLQGVLLHDDCRVMQTHFREEWRGGMYGVWDYDPRGGQTDGEPFEISMQGLGLFACRREAWPGFHPEFRGFGGEEGYIHEKFRQRGNRTLCLPFLRWLHRFERPLGVRYPLNWEDRIWNYWVGFTELGLDTRPMIDHFNDHLGRETTAMILRKLGLPTG